MNNLDHISESLETVFWFKILQFFDADPGWKKFGSGMEKIGSGMEIFGSEIRNKHPGSATLCLLYLLENKNCLVLTIGLTDCWGVKQAMAQSLIVFPSKNCLPRMSQTPWLGTVQT
jgi:hypothetical protein